VVASSDAKRVLAAMRKSKYGKEAVLIGEVKEGSSRVVMKTSLGTSRLIDMLTGDLLPRIC